MNYQRFRDDNTEGYTQNQLDELNRRYEERLDRYAAVRDIDKSLADRIAELVQAQFDDQTPADERRSSKGD